MSPIDPLLAVQDVDNEIWQLADELEALPKRRKDEEDRLADAVRRQQELEAAAGSEDAPDASKHEAVAAEIADATAFLAEIAEREGEVKARKDELEARRADLAKAVKPELLARYNRLGVSRRPVIVKLVDGVCGGCHLRQPPSAAHTIHANVNKPDTFKLVTCEMCGRILY